MKDIVTLMYVLLRLFLTVTVVPFLLVITMLLSVINKNGSFSIVINDAESLIKWIVNEK